MRKPVAWPLLGAVILGTLLAGCASGEPQRSQAAFCDVLERHNAAMAERTQAAGDGALAQLQLIMANAGEVTTMLTELDAVAPTEIGEDMHEVRTTFNDAIDRATDQRSNSLSSALIGALSGGIGAMLRILMSGPAYERVDTYANAHCDVGLFSGPH